MLVFYYKGAFILILKMLVDCSYALVPGDIVKKNLLGVARVLVKLILFRL